MLYSDKPLDNMDVAHKETSAINNDPFYTRDAMHLAFLEMRDSQPNIAILANIAILNDVINILPTAMNRTYTEMYNCSKQIHEKWHRKLAFKRKSKYDGIIMRHDSFIATELMTGTLDKYWDSLSDISKLYVIENTLYCLGVDGKIVDRNSKEHLLKIEIVNSEGDVISTHETLFQAMYHYNQINGNAINAKIYCRLDGLMINGHECKVDLLSAIADHK